MHRVFLLLWKLCCFYSLPLAIVGLYLFYYSHVLLTAMNFNLPQICYIVCQMVFTGPLVHACRHNTKLKLTSVMEKFGPIERVMEAVTGIDLMGRFSLGKFT